MKSNGKYIEKERLTYFLRLILEIAWHDVKHFEDNKIETEYKKRLKFNNLTDWKKYKASVDLLDDTEYAIASAFQYQLGYLGNKKYDFGETYIRLYGILNAVYLQMSAFVELSRLLNFPDNEKIKPMFCKLKIYHLRNIAASHTVNYENDKNNENEITVKNKKNSFRIIQSELKYNGNGINVIDENGNILTFNLKECLVEYENIARNLTIKLINHSIDKLVIKKVDKVEVRKRLSETLDKLIDYSTLDENTKYMNALQKRINKKTKHLKELNAEDILNNIGFDFPLDKQ